MKTDVKCIGTTRVVVTFEGDAAEVDSATQHYFQDYPTPGYSTKIIDITEKSHGQKKVTISRYSSAD